MGTLASEVPTVNEGGDGPDRDPSTGRARLRDRVAAHPVDAVFALGLVASYARLLQITEGQWFNGDDLKLVELAQDGRFLEPFNSHLSLVILVAYRIATDLVGLNSYLPIRIMSLGAFVAVGAAFHLHARRRVGPLPAAAGGALLVWFPLMLPMMSALNHYTSAVGAVVAAAALDHRGPRADAMVAAGIGFSLLSAGGGVAVAVACLVHAVLSRAGRRRWLATLGPTSLWLAWYLAFSRSDRNAGRDNIELVTGTLSHSAESFSSLALDSRLLGGLALVAFLALAVWRLWRRDPSVPSMVAWCAALGTWWLALMRSRPEPGQFRYWYLAGLFILLASVPARSVLRVSRPPHGTARRPVRSLVGAALVGLMFLGLAQRMAPEVGAHSATLSRHGREHLATIHLLQDPRVDVPDERRRVVRFLTAGELRALVDRLDHPPPPDDLLDPYLARSEVVHVAQGALADRSSAPCLEIPETGTLPPGQYPVTVTEPIPLEVRRFEDRWWTVGHLQPGRQRLDLPELGTDHPWQIRAPGACIEPPLGDG